jgi:hypothetical protein
MVLTAEHTHMCMHLDSPFVYTHKFVFILHLPTLATVYLIKSLP